MKAWCVQHSVVSSEGSETERFLTHSMYKSGAAGLEDGFNWRSGSRSELELRKNGMEKTSKFVFTLKRVAALKDQCWFKHVAALTEE